MTSFQKALVFLTSIGAACACSIVTTLLVLGSPAHAQTPTPPDLSKAVTYDGTNLHLRAQAITIEGLTTVKITGGASASLSGNAQTSVTSPGVVKVSGSIVTLN